MKPDKVPRRLALASAKGESPVSEGLVSLLEPFIDTLVICTITALVILASGVWTQKYENDFELSSLEIVQGSFDLDNEDHKADIVQYLNSNASSIEPFDGVLTIADGVIQDNDVTVIHNRSIAEEVMIYSTEDGTALSGEIDVVEGLPNLHKAVMKGKSLIHSVPLTAEAFRTSIFGRFRTTHCFINTSVLCFYHRCRVVVLR